MDETLIGLNIARYTLTDVIGRGGTATVYRARGSGETEEVAIKVIAPDIARRIVGSRQFENAAQAVATLRHPHIVPVMDIGRSSKGHLYIVMAYMVGGSLSRRIAAPLSPLPLSEAMRIAADIGSALDYAHARGVIHRDVKPGNILLDGEGRAYLSDFGVASFLDDRRNGEQALPFGAFAYMAPELAVGAPPDPSADIYALGVTMYELLVGKRPFDIHDLASHRAVHQAGATPDPADWPEKLGPGLRVAVAQALSPDPKARPPHAASLVQAVVQAAAQVSGGKTAEYYGLVTREDYEPPPAPGLTPLTALSGDNAPDGHGPADAPPTSVPAVAGPAPDRRPVKPGSTTRSQPRPSRNRNPLPAWSVILFSLIGFLLLLAVAVALAP